MHVDAIHYRHEVLIRFPLLPAQWPFKAIALTQQLQTMVNCSECRVVGRMFPSFCLLSCPVKTRNRFESTRSEVECLMRKMKENPHEHKSISHDTMEGYLFVQEKRSFVSTWVKYYCTYHREPKRVTMVLFDQKSGGKVVRCLFVSTQNATLPCCGTM
uniref:Uncharacterized protein n=1 Tax=Hucho hucho TaxID=62062 RepID=A0A4W5L180_9TELE